MQISHDFALRQATLCYRSRSHAAHPCIKETIEIDNFHRDIHVIPPLSSVPAEQRPWFEPSPEEDECSVVGIVLSSQLQGEGERENYSAQVARGVHVRDQHLKEITAQYYKLRDNAVAFRQQEEQLELQQLEAHLLELTDLVRQRRLDWCNKQREVEAQKRKAVESAKDAESAEPSNKRQKS